MPSRPNIILLMSDQQKYSASHISGNKVLKTPGEERLAAEGVAFTQCITQSPLCLPSRGCIMTGTYPQEHGALSNRTGGVSPDFPQVQELLKADGYCCGAVGHFHRGDGFDRGWDWSMDLEEPWLADVWYPLCRYAVDQAPGTEYGPVGWWCGRHPLKAEEAPAALVTSNAIRFLDDVASEPFFLHIAHIEPHPPYTPPHPFDVMYDPADIDLPPKVDWDKATPWLKQLSTEAGMDLCDDEQVRRVIAAYYGSMSYVDGQVVRLINHLEKRGLLDNTWIVYMSDHGDFTGEHAMMTKAEMFYDCLIHVPLIIRAPDGMVRRGTSRSELVETVDIAPTICDIAGVEKSDTMHGRSVLPPATGKGGGPLKEAAFGAIGRNYGPSPHNLPQGIVASSRLRDVAVMIRTASHKLILNPEHENEMYCLDEDPFELVNRFGDAEIADVQRDLEGRLSRWLEGYPIPPAAGEKAKDE